jgi:hypothetical protein
MGGNEKIRIGAMTDADECAASVAVGGKDQALARTSVATSAGVVLHVMPECVEI